MQLTEFIERVNTAYHRGVEGDDSSGTFRFEVETVRKPAFQKYYVAAVEGLKIHKGISTLRELQECFPEVGRTAWGQLEDDGGKGPSQSKVRKIIEQEQPNKVLPFKCLDNEVIASAFNRYIFKFLVSDQGRTRQISRCKIAWIEVAIANGWFDDEAGRMERLEIYADTLGAVHDFCNKQIGLLRIEGLEFIPEVEVLKFNELSELIYDYGPSVVAARLVISKKSPKTLYQGDSQKPLFAEVKKLMSPSIAAPRDPDNGKRPPWSLGVVLVLLTAMATTAICQYPFSTKVTRRTTADDRIESLTKTESELTQVGMFHRSGRAANLVPRFTSKPALVEIGPLKNVYAVSDKFGGLFLFDRSQSEKMTSLVGSKSTIVTMDWDLENKRIFAGNQLGEVWVWRLKDFEIADSRKVVGRLLCTILTTENVGHLKYLAGSQRLVCHDHNGKLWLIDANRGTVHSKRTAFEAFSTYLSVNKNGQLFALCGSNHGDGEIGDYAIKLFDNELNLVRELKTDNQSGAPYCSGFVAEDQLVSAYNSRDSKLIRWNILTGKAKTVLQVSEPIQYIESDGKTSIVVTKTAAVYHIDNKVRLLEVSHELKNALKSGAYDIDLRNEEILCCGNGYRSFWPWQGNKPTSSIETEYTRSGRQLLWTGRDFVCLTQDGFIYSLATTARPPEMIGENARLVISAPNKGHLLVLKEAVIEIFDENRRIVKTIGTPFGWTVAALHNNEKSLAVGGVNGEFAVYSLQDDSWEISTEEPERFKSSLTNARSREVTSVVWHPYEELCIVGFGYVDKITEIDGESFLFENALRYWRPGNRRLKAIDAGRGILRDAPRPIRFSATGEFLVAGSGYARLGVWQYDGDQFYATDLMNNSSFCHQGEVSEIGISNDSTFFSSQAAEKGVLVWNVENNRAARVLAESWSDVHCWTGDQLFVFDNQERSWLYDPKRQFMEALPLHNRSIYQAISNGRYLALGHRHGVAIFDVESKQLVTDQLLLSDGDYFVLDAHLKLEFGSPEKFVQLFLVDPEGTSEMYSPLLIATGFSPR